jgi:hypothetical protein
VGADHTNLAKRDSERSKTSKPRISYVAVDATARNAEVMRKQGRSEVRGGDQRMRDNGKEGAAFDEKARLHGARTP